MEEIKNVLKQVVQKLFGLEIEPEVTAAPKNIEADFSSNVAMKLAKELKKNPMEIAEKIADGLADSRTRELSPIFMGKVHFERLASRSGHVLESTNSSVTSGHVFDSDKTLTVAVQAPGFLNFILPDGYYWGKIGKMAENFEQNISCDEYLNKKVVCEFSDPNPFKVLHVGHLYTSIVGDAIAKLFEYAGAEVKRANFGGDVGLHVAKTIYALVRQKQAVKAMNIEDIAQGYVEGTRLYEEDEAAKKAITELNKKIYHINKENIQEGEVAELYWRGRELSYQYFDDFYESIGVRFDKYYPESSVAELGLKTVREQLGRGVYEMSKGAVIFDGEKRGLHTRVFVNKDGVPTYEAKDVGLILQKWADYQFDKSVVITGNEQLDYMKVVLKSVEQFAPELVARTSHLTHGLVKLPGNEKMSSRKGNFLRAVDVMQMVRDELAKKHNSHDEKVVLAAIKYAFLKYKMGGDIIFDPKESVEMTGNSGVYLLYSAVRAKKILEKIKLKAARTDIKASSAERGLMLKMVQYRGMLQEAVEEMAPNNVCNYLYELAQEFSRFYEKVQVVDSEFESERAQIVKVYFEIMQHGLGLMGIEIPEEM